MATSAPRHYHRRSQGVPKGPFPPKFLENIVILCFERRFSKQNSVIRQKSNFLPPKFLGWLHHWPLCHFHKSLSRFSLFYSAFLPTDHMNIQQDHCSLIANVLMIVAVVPGTPTKMSFTSIALAVIFIIIFCCEIVSRGLTRLDGARGKKQVWRSRVRD